MIFAAGYFQLIQVDKNVIQQSKQILTALRGLLQTTQADLVVEAGRAVHVVGLAHQPVPEVTADGLAAQLPGRLVRRGSAALDQHGVAAVGRGCLQEVHGSDVIAHHQAGLAEVQPPVPLHTAFCCKRKGNAELQDWLDRKETSRNIGVGGEVGKNF